MGIALLLIVIHFVGDFFFQTDKMAINKSKSNYWLTVHVSVYSLVLFFLSTIFIHDYSALLYFVMANFMLHWITDFFTSRLTSHLYQKSQEYPHEKFIFNSWRHWFFTAIGADQVIHYTCLFLTYKYIVNI